MSNFTPEQSEAIEYQGGNIMVSASAGSGKTSVMIERVLQFVCNRKAKVSEILALTFTKNAANQMKEKLKKAVREKINKGNTNLIEEYNSVQTADFVTFDSFAYNLAKKYFYILDDLSPDFTIVSNLKEQIIKTESLDETFREFYDSKDKEFLKLTDRFRFKRSDDELKSTIFNIVKKCNAYINPKEILDKYLEVYTEDGFDKLLKVYFNGVVAQLNDFKAEFEDIKYCSTNCDFDYGIKNSDKLMGIIDTLISSNDLYFIKGFEFQSLDRLTITDKMPKEYGDIKKRIGDEKKKLVDYIKDIDKYLTDYESDKKIHCEVRGQTDILVKVLYRYFDIYKKNKKEENVVDFTDLSRYAITILNDEKVRKELLSKYKYVFVDEYQDVNKVQEELINMLSQNNLFIVGDVKQSIYGFRGIQSVFNERLAEMEEKKEKVIFLDKNFRSSNKVIEMVNKIFSFCMTKENTGVNYAKNMLIPGGLYDKKYEGRANLYFVEKNPEKSNSKNFDGVYDLLRDSKTKSETRISNVAIKIAQIIEEETKKDFYDLEMPDCDKDGNKLKKVRKIKLSDICVLSRENENATLKSLVGYLTDLNIPVSSNVKQTICDFPEIKLLINTLKLIDNFDNDIPLVTVLKSPIGGFCEEELAEIISFYTEKTKNDMSFHDYFLYFLQNASGKTQEKAKQFYDYFKKLRYLSDFLGAGEILKKVINDCNYESFYMTYFDADNRKLRIEKFLELSVDERGALSVRSYLNLIETSNNLFTLNLSVGDDAVRVVTIHASKGLEYPVVIVCGAESSFNSRDESETVIFDDELGLSVKHFDDEKRRKTETMARAVAKIKMRERSIKEEMRVFYVALTRARYSLYIINGSLSDERGKSFINTKKFINFIPLGLEYTSVSGEELNIDLDRKNKRDVIFGKEDEEIKQKLLSKLNYKYPYENDTKLKLKTNVSEVLNSQKKVIVKNDNSFDISKEETGTERGIIAHTIMENYSYESDKLLNEQIENMIKNGIFSREDATSIDLSGIERAIEVIKREIKGYELYREKSFLFNIDAKDIDKCSEEKVLIQGVIDLFGIGEKDAILIDYKYSAKGDENLRNTYKKQIDLYALAIENILKKPVIKKLIINIKTGNIINI